MTDNHPITPPPELVEEWIREANHNEPMFAQVAVMGAQWGADQELLACGKYLEQCAAWEPEDVTELYNYRRPRPPSLKEQALAALSEADQGLNESEWQQRSDTIRRALEQLND